MRNNRTWLHNELKDTILSLSTIAFLLIIIHIIPLVLAIFVSFWVAVIAIAIIAIVIFIIIFFISLIGGEIPSDFLEVSLISVAALPLTSMAFFIFVIYKDAEIRSAFYSNGRINFFMLTPFALTRKYIKIYTKNIEAYEDFQIILIDTHEDNTTFYVRVKNDSEYAMLLLLDEVVEI